MIDSAARARVPAALAVAGTILALGLSLPFATAYFRAYGGLERAPFWMLDFRTAFPQLLQFAAPERVYQVYGRGYSLVLPLVLPMLLNFTQKLDLTGRGSLILKRMFLFSVVTAALGVVGDYWPPQDSVWVGIGFMFELLGFLTAWLSAGMLGLKLLRSRGRISRSALGLFAVPVFGLLASMLLGHIPSGPAAGLLLLAGVAGLRQLFSVGSYNGSA